MRKILEEEIDKILLNGPQRYNILLREHTPQILIDAGIRDLPMLMNSKHIRDNILTVDEAKNMGLQVTEKTHYHGLGKELFIKVVESIENPAAVFQWQKNRYNKYCENDYIVLSKLKSEKYESIIIPIYIKTKGSYLNILTGNVERIDTNKVKTIYGKTQIYKYLNDNIKKGNLKTIKINRGSIRVGKV